jgi:hypothetical protein
VSDRSGEATIDLGGCEGCGLGCAVACASDDGRPGREARRVLCATGLGIVLLALVPALLLDGWARAAGAVGGGLGACITVLAALALRRGRPGGDGAARLAFRMVPVAMALLLALWVLVAGRALLDAIL